ncbi:MAG: DinB family protein [Candidatus Glassbacteria bacterium]|nr:DinB family protein [Candidatus Glassbacteria bacterium]
MNEKLVMQIRMAGRCFENSSACLEEEDSSFTPAEGMFSAARQVAHVARTIDWFIKGMTDPSGFDLDWDRHLEEVMRIDSLAAARRWLKEAVERAAERVGGMSDEELLKPLPAGPVMGGVPRMAVINGIVDHTAHHRGALTVYSRLLGKVPAMPYG